MLSFQPFGVIFVLLRTMAHATMAKKVLHSALALMMILTVSGITINLHYCHDRLYDMALFAPAHSCCETGAHCHLPGDSGNMDHCEDDAIHVESTGEYIGTFNPASFGDAPVIDLLPHFCSSVHEAPVEDRRSAETFWYQEPPPPNEVDLSRIQTYLI